MQTRGIFKNSTRGMAIGQVFVFIVAIITFALILIFGYRAVHDFLQRGEEVQFYQFKNDLEGSIQKIYTEFGSVRREQFHLPAGYEQVCFVDLDAPYDGSLCDFDRIACSVWNDARSYKEADENIFLKPVAPVKLKAGRIKMEKGYLCLPVQDGRFELLLQGKGDHAYLSVR